MSGVIFNSKTLGTYDFSSHLIEISNDALNINFHQAQNIIDNKNIYEFDDAEIEFYKTYLHETIHLLDCTTTHWGLNYSCRLYSHFKKQTTESFETLLVDDSEITLHYHFKGEAKEKLNYRDLKASLQYDNDMGIYIKVHFFGYVDSYQEILDVPLSMLAVLEGHAYAQEQLFHLDILEHRDDYFSLRMIERDINEKMQQADLAEYTCILSFIHKLFPLFTMKLKLKMCVFLCRSALNTDDLTKITIPDWLIAQVFPKASKDYINLLRFDINRGNSIPAVLFIYLMAIAVYNQKNNIIDSSCFYNDMENILLNTVYAGMNISSLMTMFSLSIDHRISILQGYDAYIVPELANDVKNNNWYTFDLRKIKLPGVLLCAEYAYLYPKMSLSVDLESHIEENIDRSIELDKLKLASKRKKQHMDPKVATAWLQDIKSGKNSSTLVNYYYDDNNNLIKMKDNYRE